MTQVTGHDREHAKTASELEGKRRVSQLTQLDSRHVLARRHLRCECMKAAEPGAGPDPSKPEPRHEFSPGGVERVADAFPCWSGSTITSAAYSVRPRSASWLVNMPLAVKSRPTGVCSVFWKDNELGVNVGGGFDQADDLIAKLFKGLQRSDEVLQRRHTNPGHFTAAV